MAPANAASGGNQHQGAGRGNDHGGRGQLGATLVGARLDRIARRGIHTLSQLLEDGYSIRAADMPGADDLMIRIYAAMARNPTVKLSITHNVLEYLRRARCREDGTARAT